MASLFQVTYQGRSGSLALTSEGFTFHADNDGPVGTINVPWTEIQEIKANSASSTSAKLRLTCVTQGGEDHKYFFVFTSRSELEKARAKINALAQGLQRDSNAKQVDCEGRKFHDGPAGGSSTEHTSDITGIHAYERESRSKNPYDDSLTEHTRESTGIHDHPSTSGTTAAHDHSTGVFERSLSHSSQAVDAAKPPSLSLRSRSHGSVPRRRASTGTLEEDHLLLIQQVKPEGVSTGDHHSSRLDSVPRRRTSTGAIYREVPEEIHLSSSDNTTDSVCPHSLQRSKSEQHSFSKTFHSSRYQESLPRLRASTGTLDRQLQRRPKTQDAKSSEDIPTGQPSNTKKTLLSPILQVYPNNSVTLGKINSETEKYEPQLRMDFSALPSGRKPFQAGPLPLVIEKEHVGIDSRSKGVSLHRETIAVDPTIVPGTFTRVYNNSMDIKVGSDDPHTETKEDRDIEACRISTDTHQDPKQADSSIKSDQWRTGCIIMSICCCLVLCIAIFLLVFFLVLKDDGNSVDEARRNFYAYTYEDGAFWVRHR